MAARGRTLESVPPPYPEIEVSSAGAARARVACILVNWNGAADTLACLRALEQQTERDLAVFVVDNGSTDDSRKRIAEYLRGRAADGVVTMQLVKAGANLGFAGGNNIAIRLAAALQPEFFWLLNNDTVPPPETMALLLAEAAHSPATGLVGSVLRYMHNPAQVQAWGGGHMRSSIAYAAHFHAPHAFGPGDYLTFASVLVRTAVFRQIGLLDERFFMYYEDAEFCLRAQKAGWGMAVAAGTAVLHKEGGSRATRRSLWLERTRTVSALTLIRLHGRFAAPGMAVFLLSRLGKKLLLLRWGEVPAVLAGAWIFFGKSTQRA